MTDSSMMKYQYDSILDQLILLQLHAESPDCPCSLKGTKQGEIGEYCEPKHLRSIVALARESIAMEDDEAKIEYLEQLVLEGSQLLKKMERKLCGEEVDLGDYMSWSRVMRKPLEDICYSRFCAVPREEEDEEEEPLIAEVAEMFERVSPTWCPPVEETDKELAKLYRTLGTARKRVTEIRKGLETPMNICHGQAELFQEVEIMPGVLDPYGSRCRNPETGHWIASEFCGIEPAGISTTALGMDGLTRYEFEFKIVNMDDLVISHDPFTFEVNPDFPEELQPRIRERAATQIQVEKIAANLEPDALVTDFHVIDRGSPIVGPDLVVEAGNGRMMGLVRAVADYPDNYESYKNALKARATDYGLRPQDVDAFEFPVLVRIRKTDVDRRTFAEEANQAATISPSAIENARNDAQKITLDMLRELAIGENQSLEDALRAPKNQPFAKRFLSTLPENIQAALLDAKGYLNRDGVHRMAMAIFVSAFQGDAGLRLAEKAFESVDMDVRNVINAVARALGPLSQAEAMARSGDRDTELSIGEDLAQTINVYSAIKRTPGMTVDKYLSQSQLFARELTPFQEEILSSLEQYKSSPRKLANIFNSYADSVIKSPPPAQGALIPGEELVKEEIWRSAMGHAEEPAPPATLFEELVTLFEESCQAPSSRYHNLVQFFTGAGDLAAMAAGAEVAERKIDVAMAQLEEGIAGVQDSDNFKAFIDTMAKFHNYSLGNIMLITVQRPEASRVAGFNTWKDLGRSVKKGEKGIMILAPCFPKKQKREEPEDEEDEEKRLEMEPAPIYFKVVYVFDIGQTEGEELPRVEVPVLTGEDTRPLYEAVKIYIAKLGLNFSEEPLPSQDPDIKGFWAPGQTLIWVKPTEAQNQRTKSELHELAHAKCALRGARDAEVMAESVAYVVANHFGFDTGARSFPYVATWARDIKTLKANLETIRRVSTEMIEGIEQVATLSESKSFLEKTLEGELEESIIAGVAAAAVTGVGIGAGMKFVDWLAGKFTAQHEEGGYHGITIPKEIEIYPDKIIKHYLPADAFHEDSFRVSKPEEGILVYLGCLKGDKWEGDICEPNQTVQKTVVPNTPEYLQIAEEMIEKNPDIKVTEVTGDLEEGTDRELAEVAEALENAEEI